MFSRPWLFLLRRQILIHRRLIAFLLTVAAVLLGWSAFVSRGPLMPAIAAPSAASTQAVLPAGFVRIPVRFADGEKAGLLRPGQRIQLWATDPRTSTSRVVAADAEVTEVPPAAPNRVMSAREGRLIVVGIHVTEVNKVTTFGAEGFLSYTLDQ